MENLYKKTNFRSNPPLECPKEALVEGQLISDSMYNEHRFITHGFVPLTFPDGSDMNLLVSDIEISLSSSSEVRSKVSGEYQQRLREGLLNQQRQPPRRGHVSDDELASSVIPQGLEGTEAADYIRDIVGSQNSDVSSPVDTPPADTPPADTPPAE